MQRSEAEDGSLLTGSNAPSRLGSTPSRETERVANRTRSIKVEVDISPEKRESSPR